MMLVADEYVHRLVISSMDGKPVTVARPHRGLESDIRTTGELSSDSVSSYAGL